MMDFLKHTPAIMGIVNVTPDSFSDGGQFDTVEKAVSHARQLVDDGAHIIDIGGESTRPGADPVSLDEELSRTIPVIERIRDFAPHISIDTRHAIVMEEAMKAGANFINDVSALEDDPKSMDIAASTHVPICLMHKKGSPKDMQSRADYADIVAEVKSYLQSRIQACLAVGIDKSRLIIDPGIGFAKTPAHSFQLMKNLHEFVELECPILVGASRKSFIEKTAGMSIPANQRLGGSLAAAIFAYQSRASLLRVHDVYETVQAIRIFKSIKTA